MPCLVVLAAAIVAATLATPARADTARYAVVIGDNRGAADEPPLRYAESDAQRVADVLGDVGGVPGENLVVLRGRNAEEVRRAVIAVNERIRTAPVGTGLVLLVYYSGHGDADALHLGDTLLPLDELASLVRGSPATVRVLIVDACRSGSITRVKGGRPAPLALAAPLSGEGVIVLTASTLTEDAQESERLGGSFFTHYLLSGLRGAADQDGDRVITVAEAFGYARDQTIAASSRTLAGVQHPTFSYDLHGRGDVALADLGDTAEHGTLTLPPGATWLVVRTGPPQIVVGEIAADARRRTLSLRPGGYTLRGRTRDALLEGTAEVAVGRDIAVDATRFARTAYASLVRKGKGEILAEVSGPLAGYVLQSGAFYGVADGFQGGVVGWMWVRPSLTLSPRLVVSTHASASARTTLATLDLRVTRAWQLDRVAVDLGFVVGSGAGVRIDTQSIASGAGLVHADATLGAAMPLTGRVYLDAELAAQVEIAFANDTGPPLTWLTLNLLCGVWL